MRNLYGYIGGFSRTVGALVHPLEVLELGMQHGLLC